MWFWLRVSQETVVTVHDCSYLRGLGKLTVVDSGRRL
jgi:hypothetical protein